MFHRHARTLVAGLVIVVATSAATFGGNPASAEPRALPQRGEPEATVTLVTGDVVTMGGPRGVDVRAAKGREHIVFHSRTDPDGHVHVVPGDVLADISSGRVDERLFDVTGLVEAEYDDAHRDRLPLIVDYPGRTPRAAGARTVRELPAVSAVAVEADPNAALWNGALATARKIWLDAPVRASLDYSVPQIGAPEAWEAGFTGAGTTVAVLDTGIDVTHPDLADAVVGAQDFTGGESGTDDRFGHGTHVASIVTGAGERYRGVAPDAALLNGKVLDDVGGGYESWAIAGMEWAARSGVDVVNMSLGSSGSSDGSDPMSQAINSLTAETGTLFVVASGNTGLSNIGSPAAADAALTVGAVDREDQLADFSSRGPRSDGAIKPDLTAPGVDIVAARAANSQIGTPVGDRHVSLSGTSMAVPHAAGAAAILAGRHPDLSPEALKSGLMATAVPNPDRPAVDQGAGRVDLAAAMRNPVVVSPPSIGLGTVLWPHNDDEPITRTITYRNTGTEPVTLNVAVEVEDANGGPAPAGMFTLSHDQVTLAPGGSAEVVLTADTRVGTVDGGYDGAVVASVGQLALRTPVTVTREVESYEVTLSFLDENGAPTSDYLARLVDLDNQTASWVPLDESGPVTVRLPVGRYSLDGSISRADGAAAVLVAEPGINVTGPGRYVFDLRDAVRPGITVDRPEARSFAAKLSTEVTADWGTVGEQLVATSLDKIAVLPSRTSAPGRFNVALETQLARPDSSGQGFHASPYLYNVRHRDRSGGVPADLTTHVGDRELATVRGEYAVGLPHYTGRREFYVTMNLPATLTEYYSPNEPWYPYFEELAPDSFSTDTVFRATTPVVYRRGRTVTERWNVGVFGPSQPPMAKPAEASWRQGDAIQLSIGLHSDQDPRREGWSVLGSGSTQVYRGDELIHEEGWHGYAVFLVPPGESRYTVRMVDERPSTLSTKMSSEWTFTSDTTPATEFTPLPLLAVRFAPNLDDHNAAKAGKRFRFPVYVQRNGSATPDGVNRPAVEVSYDDGATWKPVRLSADRSQWVAEVDHPKGATFASLRASVSDADGNTAKHTIIRAYALK
ncbi:S8 family serine peptidase [Actinophytocola xanthii]|uniref:Peptidase S8/S53 domain-containing protein n=1 Tax=Actinophytocola xanthii TaxID=1912961 RepID=A0A1Q8CGV9_9PSEU|nr:S8 family serine peptidase [Actinophytocola xanthii]OLF13574.1 hypothetical protein BU204_26360 [Actinophytocola xanthii]